MFRRNEDYVEKLANDIEDKLNMDSEEIKQLSDKEFKNLLKHGYFSRKKYVGYQTEPQQTQIDVLNLHYGRKTDIKSEKRVSNVKRFYNVDRKTLKRYVPSQIRKNKGGRIIDAKTGRFVKKQN